MAGQDVVKSSKSSFMNGSPKPKQASILNFFGTKKEQQPSSSPLTKVTQNKETELANEAFDVPSEIFDEAIEFIESKPKKACISELKFEFSSKIYDDSSIIAPKILNDLHDAANTDFDQSDSTIGRYQWLVDLKDKNKIRKGLVEGIWKI